MCGGSVVVVVRPPIFKYTRLLFLPSAAVLILSSNTPAGRERCYGTCYLHYAWLAVHCQKAAAINVQLTDSGFSTEDFEVAGGQLQVKFDRIAPSANVSHTVVVKPKKFGYFNFTAAEVSYQPSEDTAEIQIGYTSEPGEGGIIAYRDYDRKFSPHVFDWIIFALLMIPVLLVPFLMWYNIKSKYIIPTHGGKKGKSD
ncbi:hypothetical protein Pcinc_011167 [Petrolisthes cinctipes]|uniref:Translocon-associated protein subunit beta n=1 Tax=Petrolisthes cinctipes TaxID=88211 RepID=A0AAE1KTQ1_PETCI|nr:hypothetical protein Pcinc_011167 [Petrolisthes cinctipes]